MLNFILIALCLLAGFLVKRFKALPADSYKAVNSWVINIALPAVALKYIPEIEWNFSLLLPLLMPLFVWAGSYLFVTLLSRFLQIDIKTRAALFLVAGLGNTSFLGFPLTEAYYGEKGLQIAVLCDQACFIVMATFGILTATKASNAGKYDWREIFGKIFAFPPFVAFCLAFILPLFLSLEPVEPLFDSLAITLIPLALFSVGMQLKFRSSRKDLGFIGFSLLYKLVLAPLLILTLCLIAGFSGTITKVSIFEAAMAPMVTGAILATDYDLNPGLANMILSIGIPISLATTFLWFLCIESLF